MGKRKTFKARRTPQYAVTTSCHPEHIDGISLKFRDLHTVYHVMVDYTKRYVSIIEAEHKRCGTAIDLNDPPSRATRALEDLIRIMLSAHLSAYESIIYYMRESFRTNQSAVDWLDAMRASVAELSALERLRNMDVHHEPFNTMIGMRYRILSVAPGAYSDIHTKQLHAHFSLAHEGVGFAPWALGKTAQFSAHPGLVDLVTFESVTQLAHLTVHAIASLLNEAIAKGYCTATAPEFRCRLCEAPGATVTDNVSLQRRVLSRVFYCLRLLYQSLRPVYGALSRCLSSTSR